MKIIKKYFEKVKIQINVFKNRKCQYDEKEEIKNRK